MTETDEDAGYKSTENVKLPKLKLEEFEGQVLFRSFGREFWGTFKVSIHENASLQSIDQLKSIGELELTNANYEATTKILNE